MPRTGGNYNLPSPPMPLVSGDLARAEDLNTTLSDIALALTNSVPTDGSAAYTGPVNFNSQNAGGVNNLTAVNVTASNQISANNAIISGLGIQYSTYGGSHSYAFGWDGSYVYCYVDGTQEGPFLTRSQNDGRYLFKSGDTCTGNLTVSGTVQGGTVQGSYVHSTNNMQVDNQIFATNGASFGGLGVYYQATGHWARLSVDTNYTTYITMDGNTICYIVSNTSDARIKNVIGRHRRGLAEILRLQVVDYSYRGNDAGPAIHGATMPPRDTQTVHAGVIAQDVEDFFPELVERREGHVDGRAVDDMRYLRPERLNWALINAMQEMAARIERLEARLEARPA